MVFGAGGGIRTSLPHTVDIVVGSSNPPDRPDGYSGPCVAALVLRAQAFTLYDLYDFSVHELKHITLDNIKDSAEQLANYRQIAVLKVKGEVAYSWRENAPASSDDGADVRSPEALHIVAALQKTEMTMQAALRACKLKGREAEELFRALVHAELIVRRRDWKNGGRTLYSAA